MPGQTGAPEQRHLSARRVIRLGRPPRSLTLRVDVVVRVHLRAYIAQTRTENSLML